MPLQRIVSGGQTGVDRGALDAALEHGYPCGGWCPAGRRAEDGRIPRRYPLRELDRGGYPARTIRNLLEADGTLIVFHRTLDGGTDLTRAECDRRGRPWLGIDASGTSPAEAVARAAAFIDEHEIRTLNVAGPRASKWAGAHAYALNVISQLLSGRILRACERPG